VAAHLQTNVMTIDAGVSVPPIEKLPIMSVSCTGDHQFARPLGELWREVRREAFPFHYHTPPAIRVCGRVMGFARTRASPRLRAFDEA
jgi:hypothetical protein